MFVVYFTHDLYLYSCPQSIVPALGIYKDLSRMKPYKKLPSEPHVGQNLFNAGVNF